MQYLSGLKYAPGSRKKRIRVGRGQGSGKGGTAGRGHKGYKARSGSRRRPYFEGGQMPIQRRLPKRGFKNRFKEVFQIVNLSSLNRLSEDKIDVDLLYEKKIIKKLSVPVKILGDGELDSVKEVQAHAFSKSAKEKIEAAGGKAIII